MTTQTTSSTTPRRSLFRRLITAVALFGILGASAWYAYSSTQGAQVDDTLVWTAERTDLRITVTERGTLQSQKTVNGVCELDGYDNKIIFIVEEGSTVKKGDVVVRFDSSEIDKEIAEEKLEVAQAQGAVETKEQEVQVAKNEGESEVAAAELELTLAKLDLEKYRDGDYPVELQDLKGKIALAKVEVEKAREELQNTRELVKKGFREPEQIRVAEQAVESAQFNLGRDEGQLKVLQDFDYRRKLTEYEAKAAEAERKLERAKSSATAKAKKAQSEFESAESELKLQQEDLAEEEAQKEKCVITATQDGVVAYANEEWWSESRRIREGGTVYERQVVFFIPDMSLMQVEVKVHESEVKRITTGQKAIIRVDAFANQSFTGTVKSVAQLSKSDRFFGSGVKEYTTIITIDETEGVALRPGMTAEVEILVDNLSDVLAVPVQAIAEHRHKHFVYAKTSMSYERTPVEIGQTNNRLIVIKSGIEEGTVVALDARSRAAEEFADDESSEDSDELQELGNESDTKADSDADTDEDSVGDDTVESVGDENLSDADDETQADHNSEGAVDTEESAEQKGDEASTDEVTAPDAKTTSSTPQS